MAGLGDIFGRGSIAEQMFVWGVLQGAISTLLTPEFNELQQLSYKILANTPLSPTDAAAETARGLTDAGQAGEEAKLSGVNTDRLARLVDLARNSPPLTDAVDAYRRGLIPAGEGDPHTPSLTGAMADSGLRPEWAPILEKLTTQLPSWQDALNAYLQGQLSEDEAKHWYQIAGGDPDAFQWLYDANGTAPTPDQALTLLNRGIIPRMGVGPKSVSYQQAFLEGPWRNKWLEPFLALAAYLPPPRTVTAMLKNGSLSDEQASTLLQHQGLTKGLAAAYINDAHHQATTTDKNLTQAQIIDLYGALLISNADAVKLLGALGYGTDNAKLLLALADLRREITALNSAVSRVQSLYIGHKITRGTAVAALNKLQLPADQVQGVVQTWDLEAAVNVKTLTESQIVDAWGYGVITQAEAETELEGLGYTPFDAWVLLSNKAKGPLKGRPARGPTPLPESPQL